MERVVDAFGARVRFEGKVPVGGDGQALEERDEEDGDGLQCVEGVEGVDGVADRASVAAQTEEEDEDGCFDERQDRVVKELGDVEPPESGGGVEFGDVDGAPAVVVEFDVCAPVC